MPGGRGQGMEEYIDIAVFTGFESLRLYDYGASNKGVGSFENLLICSAGTGGLLLGGFLGFEICKIWDITLAIWFHYTPWNKE